MPKQPAFPGLRVDEEEADAARSVPVRDGGGGPLGAAVGTDHTTLSKSRTEGRAPTDAD